MKRTRTFSLLIALAIIAGCQQSESEKPIKETLSDQSGQRHIALDGQSNFRDLGGYKTADGRKIKWGVLYRSGELHKLTDEDVARLEALRIRTVVNFLTPEEITARGRDRLPARVSEIPQPIAGGIAGDLTKVVLEARKTGDFSKVPVELNPEIHRLLMAEAREQYAALLREIAKGESLPLVFHCSHGVHRTGTAAAILLSLLGIPWETIREDYLLPNVYRKEEVEERLFQLTQKAAENQGIPPDQVDTTNMEAFYVLNGSYIGASLDEAVKEYGSMENFVREGLGLSDEEIARLRNQVLE